MNYSVQHFTSINGLPQNSITDMALDKNGFLWMTTQDGICRYDGQGFRIYNMTNTPDINFNRFALMSLSKTGQVLFMQDFEVNRFYKLQPGNTIVRDTALNINQFYATRGQTYCLISNLPPASNASAAPKFGGDGATQKIGLGGLVDGVIPYFDTLTHSTIPLLPLTKNIYTNYIIAGDAFLSDDKITIKHVSFRNGLFRLPLDNSLITSLIATNNTVWQQYIPVRSKLILFCNNNVYLLYSQAGQLKTKLLFSGFNVTEKLGQSISRVQYDSISGCLFIGSNIDGLTVLQPKQFQQFTTNNPSKSTGAQIALNNGDIVGGREHYNLQTGKFLSVNLADSKAFYKDSDGSIIYSYDKGLFRSNQTFSSHQSIKFPATERQLMEARSFLRDEKGQIWFCDVSSIGIIVKDSLLITNQKCVAGDNEMQSLFQQCKDTFWILTRLHIYAYTPHNHTLIKRPIFSNIIPRFAFKAKDGSIWLGTYGNGMYKYEAGNFIPLPRDANNFLRNAHSFYEDNNGFFWIPTNNGLFQCKKTDLDACAEGRLQQPYYYHYQSNDGFATDEFNGGFTPAYVQTGDQIVYASIDGVVHFSPNAIQPLLPTNPVFINQLLVDDKPINPLATITLPPNFNQLKLTVSSPFFGNPENLSIAYHLEGLNNRWYPVINGKNIVFNRLASGNYTMVIRKQAGFGIDNYTYQRFSFTVLPYWYETWWSKLLLLLVIISIIALLFWLRLKANKRRAAMELMLIEQQLKALRAQINPHFVENTFNFLANQMQTAPKNTAIDTMHRISAYLRNVLYRSDEPVVSLEDELAFVEEYLQVQQLLMGMPFDFAVTIADEVDIYDVEVPSMLLQPIIENALQYGMDSSKQNNHIQINITGNEHFVYCNIGHSGSTTKVELTTGIDTNQDFALTLQRMELLYKDFKHQPSLHENANAPGGWDVQIKIPLE